MKKANYSFIFACLLCFFKSVYVEAENTSSEDSYVYAVGEAKITKEKMAILKLTSNELVLPKECNEVLEQSTQVIASDFSFYRKFFEVVQINEAKTMDQLSSEYAYIVQGRVAKVNGHTISVEWTVYNSRDKKNIVEKTVEVENKNLRKIMHQVDNQIYESITKKTGIFESKIVFVGDDDDTPGSQTRELYLMDFDGENVRKLTDHQSNVISPTVSWDRKKIIYSVIVKKKGIKNIDLYLYDLETNEEKAISTLPGINSGAVFLRDNRNVLLTLSYQGNAEIYKMDIQTKELTKMTNHFSDDVDPHLSPDGKTMAFVSGRSGKAHIYLMDSSAPEKDVRRISYVGLVNATPRFSPIREELVFASWVDNIFDVFRIDLKGMELTRLTKNFGNNENPSFSPDGEFIVFSSERVLGHKKISKKLYIMDRDGEILGSVTDNLVNAHTPWWSP